MPDRTRSERRHNDWRKAIRKRKIADRYAVFSDASAWYDNLHQYSKNKIHCSCPLCRCKTTRPGTVGPAMNWPGRDKKQFAHIEQELSEYYEGDDKDGESN